jgi:hypothetical protein
MEKCIPLWLWSSRGALCRQDMKQPPLKYGLVKFLHRPVDLANPLVRVRTHQSFAEVARSTKVSFSLKAHSNKK